VPLLIYYNILQLATNSVSESEHQVSCSVNGNAIIGLFRSCPFTGLLWGLLWSWLRGWFGGYDLWRWKVVSVHQFCNDDLFFPQIRYRDVCVGYIAQRVKKNLDKRVSAHSNDWCPTYSSSQTAFSYGPRFSHLGTLLYSIHV
jgi:hypothetical protein